MSADPETGSSSRRPRGRFVPRFSIRTLLIVVALLAAALGAGRWYYDNYYVYRPITWEPFTRAALERELDRGRTVVVHYWPDVFISTGPIEVDYAIDTPEFRRLVHRHGIAALSTCPITPRGEVLYLFKTVGVTKLHYPILAVYSPSDPDTPVVIGVWPDVQPTMEAIVRGERP